MFVRNSRHDRVINLSAAREVRELTPEPGSPYGKYVVIFANGDDERFFAYPHQVEFALRRLIPAGPNDVCVVAFGGIENGEVWVEIEKHKIVAWAFDPGSDLPEAITATDGIVRADDNKIVTILRQDGKLDSPLDAIYDDEEALISAVKALVSKKKTAA